MHFSNFTMITQRVSLSIAIIAMVNSTQQHGLPNTSTEGPLADTLNNPSRSMKEFNTGVSIMENDALWWEGKPSLKGRILILWSIKAWIFNDQLKKRLELCFWDIAYLCDKNNPWLRLLLLQGGGTIEKIVKTSTKEQNTRCLPWKTWHRAHPSFRFYVDLCTFHCLGAILQFCKLYITNSNARDFCPWFWKWNLSCGKSIDTLLSLPLSGISQFCHIFKI